MKTSESAPSIFAIDGCLLNSVKGCLENAGFTKFVHLQLADLGFEKGKTYVNDKNHNQVYNTAVKVL